MYAQFARTLSRLRHETGVSQRQAAQELGVSQALLSHYENGIREPGLAFVVRACDYYQVSADYLLGRQNISGEGQTTPLPAPEEAAADLLAELCQELCRRSPASRAILSRWAGELAQGAGEKPAAPPRKSKAVKV